MMKSKKLVLFICVMGVLALAGAVFAGARFFISLKEAAAEKEAAEQEEVRRAQEVAEQHLKETYDEEMVCFHAYKNILKSEYFVVEFYPKEQPELHFQVTVNEDFTIWYDNFLKVRAEEILTPIYEAYIREMWGDKVSIHFYGNSIASKFYIHSDSAVELTQHSLFRISIRFPWKVTEMNATIYASQISDFLDQLSEENLQNVHIFFSYSNDDFTYTPEKTANLTTEQIADYLTQ